MAYIRGPRRTAAPITAKSTGNYNGPGSRSWFADSSEESFCCEARKTPAVRVVFFLTSPFVETYQVLMDLSGSFGRRGKVTGIRWPRLYPRGLERFAVRMHERCVRVPKRVPRDLWQLELIARRRELPAAQVRRSSLPVIADAYALCWASSTI
jgi:hypothetical protein